MPLEQLFNVIHHTPDIGQECDADHLMLLQHISLARSTRHQDSPHLHSGITVHLQHCLKMGESFMPILMLTYMTSLVNQRLDQSMLPPEMMTVQMILQIMISMFQVMIGLLSEYSHNRFKDQHIGKHQYHLLLSKW